METEKFTGERSSREVPPDHAWRKGSTAAVNAPLSQTDKVEDYFPRRQEDYMDGVHVCVLHAVKKRGHDRCSPFMRSRKSKKRRHRLLSGRREREALNMNSNSALDVVAHRSTRLLRETMDVRSHFHLS